MQNNLSGAAALKEGGKTLNSAYIHIPFCKRKCKYCAFTSFQAPHLIDDYIKKLVLEIKEFYNKKPLETLYIGGGTPSLLDIKHFKKIISMFKFALGAEITVEINPESASLSLLAGLYKLGVNRLSIGVQDFDDTVLQNIGRLHTSKSAKDTIYLAQDIGFENISIDLIYGLPETDLKHWQNTLETAISLDIQHISLYGLKLEEGTEFYRQYDNKRGGKHLPDDDMQADMYEEAIRHLTHGFEHYEISNFATAPEFKSKHNINYWKCGKYYGFGVGAAGYIDNIRYQNTKNFKEYMENPHDTKELAALDEEQMLEEEIFLGFRLLEGINIAKINEKYEIDFDKKYANILKKFLSTGHIEKTENGYKLTIEGILISNAILSEFLI